MSFHVPERHRVRHGELASLPRHGNNGAFELPAVIPGRQLWTVASDGLGWEHVSVSVRQKKRVFIPTWKEMAHVKALFWDAEDVVIQYHPARSQYVNNHEAVLHLWRPVGVALPVPDANLVGRLDKCPQDLQVALQTPGMTLQKLRQAWGGVDAEHD